MTDTTAAGDGPGKLDIAKVIGGTFSVLSRNIVTFGLLALLLAGIPSAIINVFSVGALRDGTGAISQDQMFTSAYWSITSMAGLGGLIFSAILQGALIHATVQDLNGARPSIADCLATGLRNFLPLIGVTILFFFAFWFGVIFLFVPGIMIACAWCVAIPSLVADRTGVFGAFSRSAELTRGNRWRILALGLVVGILLLVLGMIFNAIAGIATFGADAISTMENAINPLGIAIAVVRSTISAVIGAAVVAVLYVELRRAREGLGPQWLAEVFS